MVNGWMRRGENQNKKTKHPLCTWQDASPGQKWIHMMRRRRSRSHSHNARADRRSNKTQLSYRIKKEILFQCLRKTRLLFLSLHSTFIFMVLYGSFVLCSDWRTYLLFLNLIGTYYVLLLYWISVPKSFYTLRRRTFDFILLRSTIGIW